MTRRKMKDSGVAWIGQVPEGWKVFPLKYGVTKIGSGKTPLGGAEVYTDEGVLFLRSQNVYDDGLLLDDVKRISCEIDNGMLGTRVVPGDVLLNITGGSIGRCCLYALDEKANVNQHVCIIRTRRDLLTNSFVRYYFNGFKENIVEDNQQGGNRESLNFEQIGNLRLPLPPLPEQRKIAAFLDGECGKIDRLRGKVEKQIAALEEYRKSVITEAVTKGIRRGRKMKPSGVEWIGEVPAEWCVLRVKNVGTSRNGLTYSPNDVVNESDGTLVLRSSNVQRGKLVVEDCVYVKTMVPKEIRIAKGDILICSRNGSRELIGKNALIESDINASFGAFMMVFRSCGADCKYLYWILNSTMFGYYFGAFSTSTINQLTRKDFGEMRIPTPTIPEQREIAAYLDKKCAAIDSMVAKCSEELDRLAEYKKSLIYEYVTGKKEVA